MTARTKIILSSLSLAIAAATAPVALAQTAITTGAEVKDSAGAVVGTISAVEGADVILKTDKYQVRFPAQSFTAVDGGYLFGMTQAQVNAAVEAAKVDPAELLKMGAVVRDPAGGLVGTIEKVDAGLATVKLPTLSVNLPVSAFAADQTGLVIGLTAAELEAQVQAAAPAAAPTTN